MTYLQYLKTIYRFQSCELICMIPNEHEPFNINSSLTFITEQYACNTNQQATSVCDTNMRIIIHLFVRHCGWGKLQLFNIMVVVEKIFRKQISSKEQYQFTIVKQCVLHAFVIGIIIYFNSQEAQSRLDVTLRKLMLRRDNFT